MAEFSFELNGSYFEFDNKWSVKDGFPVMAEITRKLAANTDRQFSYTILE